MKISECMSRDVHVCAPDHTLQSAARTMAEIDAGFLPVGEGERLIGIVTDRDIAVRGVARGCSPQTSIGDVMSGEIRYCYDDEDADTVLGSMAQIQVRRMPVVDRDKRLVGIVSITDLARGAGNDAAGDALNDIAQPSDQHSQSL